MKVLNIFLGLMLSLGLFSNTAFAATCALDDVTAKDKDGNGPYSASACVYQEGNDAGGDIFATEIYARFSSNDALLKTSYSLTISEDDTWQQIYKVENVDVSSGDWKITDPLALLKLTNPFIVVLKSGNENNGTGGFIAYLFDFVTNGEGEYSSPFEKIIVKGNGQTNTITQDISHISVYGLEISPVPVPAAAWLMAPVFAGFMLRRRKA